MGIPTICVRCRRDVFDHSFFFLFNTLSGGRLAVIAKRYWMQTRARCEVELVTSRGKLAYANNVFIMYE